MSSFYFTMNFVGPTASVQAFLNKIKRKKNQCHGFDASHDLISAHELLTFEAIKDQHANAYRKSQGFETETPILNPLFGEWMRSNKPVVENEEVLNTKDEPLYCVHRFNLALFGAHAQTPNHQASFAQINTHAYEWNKNHIDGHTYKLCVQDELARLTLFADGARYDEAHPFEVIMSMPLDAFASDCYVFMNMFSEISLDDTWFVRYPNGNAMQEIKQNGRALLTHDGCHYRSHYQQQRDMGRQAIPESVQTILTGRTPQTARQAYIEELIKARKDPDRTEYLHDIGQRAGKKAQNKQK